jgi:hypothetical protein
VDITKIIFKRSIALIILRISGTLAAGSIGGVELWQSALIAAFIGIMDVAESLSRSYVVDGDLTVAEINTAFASSAEAELSAAAKASEVAAVAAAPVVATVAVTAAPLDEDDEDVELVDDEDDAPTA